MKTQMFHAPAISCGHCETSIRKALFSKTGIERVEVDIPDKQITVEFDDKHIGRRVIEEVLAAEGYPIGQYPMARGDHADSSCCGSCHV